MSGRDWSDAENDLLVADYFAMLCRDLAGEPYVKAHHAEAIRQLLDDRSRKSVEFKYMNLSAVLLAFGQPWIPGFRPAPHYQASLEDAVWRWLSANPNWIGASPAGAGMSRQPSAGFSEPNDILWIGPPPTASNAPPPPEIAAAERVARRFDVAAIDARNRALGRAGEERIVLHERATLRAAHRDDLAREVRWVADEDGDGAGYDVLSFDPSGERKLIEVKTTNGWERTPFHVTRNELAAADQNRAAWRLVRLWNFAREPKGYELRPPLDRHVALTPTSFLAMPR
jgi:hypothetical protein